MSFPFYKQPDAMDCGPTCLRIIAKHYGRSISLPKLRTLSETTREGSSLKNLATTAEKIGFRTLGVKISFKKLVEEAPLPCIVHWRQQHFVVVYKVAPSVSPKGGVYVFKKLFFALTGALSGSKVLPFGEDLGGELAMSGGSLPPSGELKGASVFVSDPAHGLLKYTQEEFIKNWIGNNADKHTEEGIVLLLEPTPQLKQVENDDFPNYKASSGGNSSPSGRLGGASFLFGYLSKYKKFIVQLAVGLLAGSLLQLIFPFLTQSIVDVGIQNQDINFIYLILIAQLFLFFGRMSIELIRGWILLHLSTRINISLVSDFFIKLMNLPIAFFDSKMTGDIMQRISDHKRIEELLTNTSLNTLFSFVNLIVFGVVLAWYDVTIFAIFFAGSTLYFGWITMFLKRRKDLDYKRFSQLSAEQTKVMELINGMQEIKLHNAEQQKRWSWEFLQAQLFKIRTKSLVLEQTQTMGSNAINEIKNIFITVFSAKLVIDGQITLGMMMAISYIIGQLNAPIQQLIGFVYAYQDAKIALERLTEIHGKEDEEAPSNSTEGGEFAMSDGIFLLEEGVREVKKMNISLVNVCFRYIGTDELVINNLNLTIPFNKTTAIVGSSGSGKTTLMKMLLKFYEPIQGEIKVGNINLNNIRHRAWRSKCGSVMQEGFIFNDSIANNIAIGEELVDKQKLLKAVEIANIKEFIENLPLAYNTKIGASGVGMSTGQKQRLLIARAVYKNPEIIFFDEATSALDAHNEKVIMENLNQFFMNRTAVVIAHRLSTVKNADQIVVLDKGKIIEKGTHDELINLKGSYYNLVKNQLELEKLEVAHPTPSTSRKIGTSREGLRRGAKDEVI